jgi:DNA gyrase subunit A
MKTTTVAIDQEMRRSYLDYSMSVIIGRAIPDARDGLKPVHRRILFAMMEAGNTHNRPYKKSARIVGDVIGKYHPHGDAAVYDAIVRMAQPFSMRYTLVDGQGNFGSIDGDPPAAMRYTEIRMSRLAEEMLADIDKDTVGFHPNYDESLQEPDVLPSRIPALLLNGSSGIAVGMATSIPPHNLGEITDALNMLIDNPSTDLREVMKVLPGPDFPTGGIIFDGGEIERAYRTGRGIITVRGRVLKEEDSNRSRLLITEIPFAVNKADLIERVAVLANEKKIDGIATIRDESDKDGMRVVVELKRGASAEVVENQLYKLTTLQSSFSMNMLAIHNGKPSVMGLMDMLRAFLDFREEVITRRSLFELNKARERVHILDGLLKALEHIDEIVAIIKSSADAHDARHRLMVRFEFTEVQAQAILDMRLQRLTGLEREKLADEHASLTKEIERLSLILSDKGELLKVIRAEISSIADNYRDDRRSMIVRSAIGDFNAEDLIADEKMVVTITKKGYIKRTEVDKYRTQKRGGVGVKGASMGEGDFIEHVFVASNHTSILYFTTKGRVYHTKVYEAPERDRALKGVPLVNLRPIQKDERICAILAANDLEAEAQVVMVTAMGCIKRTELKNFRNVMRTGIIACSLEPGDEVISARLTTGEDKIIVASRQGKAIVFPAGQVRVMGRQAAGVRAIRLDEGDSVVGMDVIVEDDAMVVNLTEYGFGKKTPVGKYPVQNRAGKGVYTVNITRKTGALVGLRVVRDTDELIIISSSGQIIRLGLNQIRTTKTRSAQGVRVIRLKAGEKIVDFTKYVGEDEADEKVPGPR